MTLGKLLVVVGLVLVAVGVVLQLAPQVPLLGKLPGDLRIERDGFRLYVPITTCIVLSIAVSALLQLLSRLR